MGFNSAFKGLNFFLAFKLTAFQIGNDTRNLSVFVSTF